MYCPKYIALLTINLLFIKAGYTQGKAFTVFLDPPLFHQQKLFQQVNLAYGGGDTLPAVMQMTLTDGRNTLYTHTYTQDISSSKTAYSLEWKPSGFRGTGLFDLYKTHGFFPYSDALRYELTIATGADTFRYAQGAEASRIIPSDHPLITGFLSYYDRKMARRVRPSYGRLVRSYFEREGLTVTIRYMDGKRYLDIYHLSAYIGSYRHDKKSLDVPGSYELLPGHMTFDVLSYHDVLKKDRSDRAVSGTLYNRSQVSTGREKHASVDNNYTELGGSIQVPVLGLPFTVNGMYTTQDRHRNFKSSYINVSFDRSGLLAQLEEQQAIYSDNADKVKNAGAFAGSRVQDQLQAAAGARDRILGEIRNELSILISRMADSATARSGVAGTSYGQYAGMYKDPSTIRPEQLDCAGCDTVTRKRLEKIGRLARQLETYNTAYEAVKTRYAALQDKQLADSLQIDNFTQRYYNKEQPVKEQLPALVSRLPNGRLKQWATRLTNFDAGMLSGYHSDYTLAGQMTKGLDAGYDFKLFKAGTNLGYTDYLSPDGSVLRYKTGLGKLVFNPADNQDVQVSYFAYAPLQKQQDIPGYGGIKGSYGGLLDAAHNRTDIFSALYAAEWDRLTLKLDYSHSRTANEAINFRNLDNSAFNVQAGLRYIPGSDLLLAYEHMGRAFENRVLPFLFSGTQKIKLQNTGIYFQNKIRVRLEYQLLLQSSTYYSGRNRKLGAEIQTRFKQLPNLTVAYKPFTTFRTLTDTFQVQQRPMMGDVFIVKANYILKTGSGGMYTFNTFYNYNRSQVDTSRYSSSNIQLMAAYVRKGWTANATAGYVGSGGDVRESMSGTDQALLFNNTFETLQLSGQVHPAVTAGGGLELAHAGPVIVRLGVNLQATLAPKRWPVQCSAMVRWMRYNKALTTGNPGIAAFNLGIYYTFSNKKRQQ